MNEKTVKIPAMSCGHCIMHIKQAASELVNVEVKEIDLAAQSATFRWKSPSDWKIIAQKLEEIGYPPKES